MAQPVLRVSQGIVFQRVFRWAGGQHSRGIVPAAETHELIGSVQVFLRTSAGDAAESIRPAAVQQRQVQRVNGQAFLQETPVLGSVPAALPQGGSFQAAGFQPSL